MSVPPPHRLTLPNVPINEQGMRQLEIWLEGKFGRRGFGLQYHRAKRYGAHNIGDWLFVESTSAFPADIANARVQGGQTAMLFKADSHNTAGSGIILWSHDDVVDLDPVWQIYPGGLIYFLDGEQDLGYTEGGNAIRYSGGGNILFYTTDGLLPNSGDFQVATSGTSDDSAVTTGSIQLGTTNTVNGAGNITLHAAGVTPGYVWLSTAPGVGIPPNSGEVAVALDVVGIFRIVDHTKLVDRFTVAEDSTTTVNLDDTKTFVVNDHLGSPLVTYTG